MGTAAPDRAQNRAFAPDFMVIGAMRAGTTSLQGWLSALRDVSLPAMKETDFFVAEKNWHRGFDWYRGLFSRNGMVTGEISPNYTKRAAFPGVPARVAAANPDTRLVYIVRDPVARAVSQFQLSLAKGTIPPASDLPGTAAEAHILEASRYFWQLEPWLDEFPREQLLILQFEELIADPLTTLGRIGAHAGFAAPETLPAGGIRNDSDSVARLPRWWHALRERETGVTLRRLVPPVLKQGLKALVAKAPGAPVPDFPDALRERFREELAEDAAAFRHWSGLALEGWDV